MPNQYQQHTFIRHLICEKINKNVTVFKKSLENEGERHVNTIVTKITFVVNIHLRY